MTPLSLFRRRAGVHTADAVTERIPRTEAAPAPAGEKPHGVATPETLAALVAKAEAQRPGTGASDLGVMGATPTLPHALPSAWRNGVPAASEVIPFVPLTLPASIYDAMSGDEKTARPCGYCAALSGREDVSWRYDAHQVWSCPSCQAGPEWRSPSLPGVRITADGETGPAEAGIMARSLLAVNPRPVRQRPDGLWMAAVPIEGRIKALGPFEREEDARAVYGTFLGAATEAAEAGAA